MDHSVSIPNTAHWRTTALVASALAAFELILLVIIVLALIARPLVGGGDERPDRAAAAPAPAKVEAAATKAAPATTESAPPAAPAEAAPKLERNETLVIVLNGNGSQGAAMEKADLVRTKSYLIAGTANAPRTDFERSVVMFRPGYRPEAQRLAKDFGVHRVSPLDGLRPVDLQGAHVALIVGRQ